MVDKHVNLIFLQIGGQLQFNGHPSLIKAQVPDTFSQNSIDHRPYLVLSAPEGIEVSHKFFITLHGFPTATVFDGISPTTTEPAPMVTLSPMVTPGRMVTLPPIHTLLPMVTGFAHS